MLYFYETSSHVVTHAKAIELDLGHAFETPSIGSVQVAGGPGNEAGVLFSARPDSTHIRYKPESQTWEPYPGKEGLWLGYWKDKRPKPEDLIRRKPRDGHFVKLCDGREWLIPVARAINGATPLPRTLRHDGKNWMVGDVEETYKEYFAQACLVWDDIFGPEVKEKPGEDDKFVVTIANGSDIAAMALAINYRISVAEVSFLGLLNTQNMGAVLRAVVDFPALDELIKKKLKAESEGQSSTPGEAG